VVQQLLTDIADRGLSLHADGADLRLLGPRAHMDTDLVARIRANKPALLEALRVPDGTPPTGLQRSYLLGRQDLAGTGATASYVYHEFLGTWDVKRLERALNEVIARHDSLRTRFTDAGMRVVEPFVRLRVDVRDLRQLDPAARTETLARLREERSHRVLPVDRAPLVSCEVSLLGGEQMICSVGHDGLALDGISMFLFFRELQQAYDGALATTPSPVSFDAYVDVLRRRGADTATRRAAEQWRARLDDLPESPQLPMRAEPGSTRFHRREIRIGVPRWQALQRRIQAAATTPTAVLLGAYAEVLSFWGAGPRMTITTTVADRPPIHPGIYGAVGQFSDVLLVELDADPGQPFQDRVEAVTARLRRDLDNRRYSGLSVLRDLHERTGPRSGHGNRMPYTFNSTLGYPDAAATGSALSAFGHETFGVSQTPGVWLNVFVMEQDGALVIQFDGVDGLFVDGVLDGLVESYRTLLGGLLEERAWAAPTHDLLPAAQRARRRAVNDTAAPMCEEQAHEAFFRRAAEAPDAVAVIAPGRTLSYGELAARAREVASWVRHQGAGRAA
jgi:pyochelin synthetase